MRGGLAQRRCPRLGQTRSWIGSRVSRRDRGSQPPVGRTAPPARARPPCVLRSSTTRLPHRARPQAGPIPHAGATPARASPGRWWWPPPQGGVPGPSGCGRDAGRQPRLSRSEASASACHRIMERSARLCRPSHAVTPPPSRPRSPGPTAKRPQAASANSRPRRPPRRDWNGRRGLSRPSHAVTPPPPPPLVPWPHSEAAAGRKHERTRLPDPTTRRAVTPPPPPPPAAGGLRGGGGAPPGPAARRPRAPRGAAGWPARSPGA
jgi:hypothetical protein